MHETVRFLEQHGYWLLVGAVLGRQACLPIPANLLLVAAGALAHSGTLNLAVAIGLSVISFLIADFAWYEAGRRAGHRIMHFVSGFSRDPGAYVGKATRAYSRYGARSLIISKFVPGLDAVSAPMAGSAGLSPLHFIILDGLGALFWSGTYVALGYIFSNQLDLLATHLARIGAGLALIAAGGFAYYLAHRLARWRDFLRHFRMARITPEQLRDKVNAGENILIVDLQRARANAQLMAIPGAVRINPHRLEKYEGIEISPSREVVLYCASPGDFTSGRVALALQRRGVKLVRPLAGGFQAWRDRGFPVTAEVAVPSIVSVTQMNDGRLK
jgi:membrane protein DedA with SNARE-associated domain/rhodanese-related sulfurtransferase